MTWDVWVPYRGCPSTNNALEMLRSDGYSAAAPGRRFPRAQFNEHAAAVKEAVALQAKLQMRGVQLCGDGRLVVSFVLYPAWDDDAGLIPAKWVLDGLVRAGLCKRDRRVFDGVEVRTIREWCELPQPAFRHVEPAQGILVHVDTA